MGLADDLEAGREQGPLDLPDEPQVRHGMPGLGGRRCLDAGKSRAFDRLGSAMKEKITFHVSVGLKKNAAARLR